VKHRRSQTTSLKNPRLAPVERTRRRGQSGCILLTRLRQNYIRTPHITTTEQRIDLHAESMRVIAMVGADWKISSEFERIDPHDTRWSRCSTTRTGHRPCIRTFMNSIPHDDPRRASPEVFALRGNDPGRFGKTASATHIRDISLMTPVRKWVMTVFYLSHENPFMLSGNQPFTYTLVRPIRRGIAGRGRRR